jgi:hypothetical protein
MGNFRKLATLLILLAVSAFLLTGISLVQRGMNDIIKEKKLMDTDPVENAPPIVAFTTVALGSFRGLLADLLWLRSIALQDEGNYFEMVQLASWITKLQPRFSGATAYLAWNMAYNISVTCSSPVDRWRWVKQGIELIRDEAIQYNPSDPVLYKELGWIYQHKVGNIMDDANKYYKQQMALALMKAFGGPEPNWRSLAAAPKDMDAFIKEFPKKDIFWKALKDAGFDSVNQMFKNFQENEKLPETFLKTLNDPEKARMITDFFRAHWLRKVFKLKPRIILEINEKYGALDWRLPEAHAIYWAYLGLQNCRDNADISLERMITQSLKDAFEGGNLLMVDEKNFKDIITVPNFNVLEAVLKTYNEAYEKNKSKSFISAKENFLKDAIVQLYVNGKFEEARKYYKILGKDFPGNRGYKISFDRFVLKEVSEDIQSATMRQANDLISSIIRLSCVYLVYGDIDAAKGRIQLAKLIYRRYEQDQSGALERTGLAPFGDIKWKVTENCVKNFPPPLSKILKAQLEQEYGMKYKDILKSRKTIEKAEKKPSK